MTSSIGDSEERTIKIEPEPEKNLTSGEVTGSPDPIHQDHQLDELVERIDPKPGATPDIAEEPVKTTERQKDASNQEDRDTILNASLHLFAKQGVYQTSLVDISIHAELTKTVLYKHFQNKEAIAEALHSDLTTRLNQTLTDIHKNSTTSISCLRSIVEFILDLTEQAPDVARLLFCPRDTGLFHNKDSKESFPAYQKLIEILESGMGTGELEQINPNLAYSTFMGMLSQIINLHLDGLITGSFDQHISNVWYPLWRALGKNPNRPS